MVDASDFHGQGVDRQRRDEFNNVETPKSQGFHPGGDSEAMQQQDLEGNALQVRSLQVNENRSQFGHVNTVIGKCSLEDPVSE